jgi:succinate dehydrogenase / fumarate reductase membrane anchor subunit
MSRGAQGLRAWLLQRVTAVYLGLFTLYLLFHFLTSPPAGYPQWSAWTAHPLVTIGLALYVLAVLLHAWVGMRDVLIDYVHPVGVRLSLLGLIAFGLLGCGLWALRALLLNSVT